MAPIETADEAASLTHQINQKLRSLSRHRSYAAVQVLTVYWQDGDEGFRREGEALGDLFRCAFHYDVIAFPIPTVRSQQRLQHVIQESIFKLEESTFIKDNSALLIVHYGGHGDPDDDRKAGELRQSVWAA